MNPKADKARAGSGNVRRRHSAGFYTGPFDSGFTSYCYRFGKRAGRGFWQQCTECRDGKQWVWEVNAPLHQMAVQSTHRVMVRDSQLQVASVFDLFHAKKNKFSQGSQGHREH